MRHLQVMCIVGTILTYGSGQAWGDAFSDARRSMNVQVYQRDQSAVSVRAGINLNTGVTPGGTTLFRAQANIGGGCGGFDFRQSMVQAFQEMPQLFEALLEAVIHEMPMLGLCYLSPTLCQLSQHFQSLLNIAIQAKYAQCQQIQHAAMYAGLRLRGGEEGRCLEDERANGANLLTAMQRCTGELTAIRSPLGVPRGQVNLVRETLEAVGASAEVIDLARQVVGEVTVRAGGRLAVDAEQTPDALMERYEQHKNTATEALQNVVNEYRDTGTVQEETLRQAGIPGQGLPLPAAEALAGFAEDPVRGPSFMGQMSTRQAIAQLTWECHEIQNKLEAATENNQHLSPEERTVLQKRYETMQRHLLQVTQKALAADEYRGSVNNLLEEYTRVQQVATRAGITAPMRRTPVMPFRTQTPSGYTR